MKINHSVDNTNLKKLFENDPIPEIDIKNEVLSNIDNTKMRKPFKLSLCSFLILLMLGTVSAAAIGGGTLNEIIKTAFNNRKIENSNITIYEKKGSEDGSLFILNPFEYKTINDMEKEVSFQIKNPGKLLKDFTFNNGIIGFSSYIDFDSFEYNEEIKEEVPDKTRPMCYSLKYKREDEELYLNFSINKDGTLSNSSMFSLKYDNLDVDFITKGGHLLHPSSKDIIDLNKENITIPSEIKNYIDIIEEDEYGFIYIKYPESALGLENENGKFKYKSLQDCRELKNIEGNISIFVNPKCTLSKEELIGIMKQVINLYEK